MTNTGRRNERQKGRNTLSKTTIQNYEMEH